MDIRFEKREHLQEKPDQKNLGFGKHFTDYMFVMDWDKEQGWHDAAIVPYGGIPMDPATMVLHYAQETFEGLKAYRTAEGKIQLFRPEMNARRMIKSNERLCMPGVPEEMFVEAVKALVKAQEDWVPSEPGTSLYIRPFMFATEASLGVHMAKSYKFVIITTPVGAYYAEGINPVKILVEDEYVRAVKGGTGFTKCGGNYASSIAGQVKAEKMGCTQVLWLDGVHRKYVEEVGTMNIMFKIAGEIYTAPLCGKDPLICILLFYMVYSTGVVQPYLSSSLPHWIPVRVSYSFWVSSPILKSFTTTESSLYTNSPTGDTTAAVPVPNASSSVPS